MTLHLGISIKINNQQGLHELAVQVNHRSAADKGAILGEVSLCDLTYTWYVKAQSEHIWRTPPEYLILFIYMAVTDIGAPRLQKKKKEKKRLSATYTIQGEELKADC